MTLAEQPAARLAHFAPPGREMKGVLKHPFFQLGGEISQEIKDQLDRIEKAASAAEQNAIQLIAMGKEHQFELQRTREVLLKGIFEATEVTTPTCFVVLNRMLPTEEEHEKMLERMLSRGIAVTRIDASVAPDAVAQAVTRHIRNKDPTVA